MKMLTGVGLWSVSSWPRKDESKLTCYSVEAEVYFIDRIMLVIFNSFFATLMFCLVPRVIRWNNRFQCHPRTILKILCWFMDNVTYNLIKGRESAVTDSPKRHRIIEILNYSLNVPRLFFRIDFTIEITSPIHCTVLYNTVSYY